MSQTTVKDELKAATKKYRKAVTGEEDEKK
jgi:hypothetical protein